MGVSAMSSGRGTMPPGGEAIGGTTNSNATATVINMLEENMRQLESMEEEKIRMMEAHEDEKRRLEEQMEQMVDEWLDQKGRLEEEMEQKKQEMAMEMEKLSG